MRDNFEEKILNNVKSKIAISKFKEEDKLMKNKSKSKFNRAIVAASIILVFSAGIVFAKDIENFIIETWGLKESLPEVAVDNGYIGTSEMDYIEVAAGVQLGNDETIVDTVSTKLKITDFIMTNDLFEFEVDMKFDEKINQYKDLNKRVESGNIDYENFGSIELERFFILDENNNLIVSSGYDNEEDKSTFNKFCKEHDLDYTYMKYNEKYYVSNGTIASSPNVINPEENLLENIIFSIRQSASIVGIDGQPIPFPKSENLTIYFSKISFVPKLGKNDGTDEVHLVGDWKIELDIPKIMQDREDYVYKVVSCDNKDFEITEAIADEMGFEMQIAINNVEEIKEPQELLNWEAKRLKESNGSYSIDVSSRENLVECLGSEELADMYEQYEKDKKIVDLTGEKRWYYETGSDGSYIINSNGEKFDSQGSAIPFNFKADVSYDENGYSIVTPLNIYEGRPRFSMTKFEATDQLTVVINFKGNPVKIELERVK